MIREQEIWYIINILEKERANMIFDVFKVSQMIYNILDNYLGESVKKL